jgi:hypothetical protein
MDGLQFWLRFVPEIDYSLRWICDCNIGSPGLKSRPASASAELAQSSARGRPIFSDLPNRPNLLSARPELTPEMSESLATRSRTRKMAARADQLEHCHDPASDLSGDGSANDDLATAT